VAWWARCLLGPDVTLGIDMICVNCVLLFAI
jgi:hypothetical protein